MIPRIIHHVWPGEDTFRKEFHRFRASWMTHHPDWSLLFWRLNNLPREDDLFEGSLRILLDDRYSVTPKADILRFEVLRLYGGLYVDTDMECLRPFSRFMEHDFFCGYEDANFICASLVGAEKGNAIVTEALELAIAQATAEGPERLSREPNLVTGPVPFTKVVLKNKGMAYPPNYFYPIPLGVCRIV